MFLFLSQIIFTSFQYKSRIQTPAKPTDFWANLPSKSKWLTNHQQPLPKLRLNSTIDRYCKYLSWSRTYPNFYFMFRWKICSKSFVSFDILAKVTKFKCILNLHTCRAFVLVGSMMHTKPSYLQGLRCSGFNGFIWTHENLEV